MSSHSVRVPWGTRENDSKFELVFPEEWKVKALTMLDAPRMQDNDIREAVLNPLGMEPLRQYAKGKKRVVFFVEDGTRPVRFDRIFDFVLQELKRAGIRKEQIHVVICNGGHAPMNREALINKLGNRMADEFLVLNHSPYENLAETGAAFGKTQIRVNRIFLDSDLRIGLGSIIPHSFAAFSSGAKLVVPGLSDIETLEKTHRSVMMGLMRQTNDPDNNRFRSLIEQSARDIGFDFFVGAVPNSKSQIAGVFCGDFIEAHRKGVSFAKKIYKTSIDGTCDVAILNAYPKDSELLQADAALMPLKSSNRMFVKQNGIFVIMSRCSEGYGFHSLFSPGMRLYRKPLRRRMLQNRDFLLFSPNINQMEFNTLYWEEYCLKRSWESIIFHIRNRFPSGCQLFVFPYAPLQLLAWQT